jgi:hypothetical protein
VALSVPLPNASMLLLLDALGELAALTRHDLDAVGGWVHIRHGLVELGDGSLVVGPPKTAAGRRTVAIPANLLPAVREHLAEFVAPVRRPSCSPVPRVHRCAGATPRSTGAPRSLPPASTASTCMTYAIRIARSRPTPAHHSPI